MNVFALPGKTALLQIRFICYCVRTFSPLARTDRHSLVSLLQQLWVGAGEGGRGEEGEEAEEAIGVGVGGTGGPAVQIVDPAGSRG